jgi:asparaginyl-tRNA synthetase
VEINDGSTTSNMQVVVKPNAVGFEAIKKTRTGCAFYAVGTLKLNEKNNTYELDASEIAILKEASEDYPLQKKEHSMEFLREIAHLRARSSTINAIMRVRSKLAFAIHQFFQSNGYL